MRHEVCTMQIGKNGLTAGFIEALNIAFQTHDNVKISVLKSAIKDKTDIEKIASGILKELGNKFTCRKVGHTLFVKKWRKPQN